MATISLPAPSPSPAVAEGKGKKRVRDLTDKVAADRDRPRSSTTPPGRTPPADARRFAPEMIIQCVEAAVEAGTSTPA